MNQIQAHAVETFGIIQGDHENAIASLGTLSDPDLEGKGPKSTKMYKAILWLWVKTGSPWLTTENS